MNPMNRLVLAFLALLTLACATASADPKPAPEPANPDLVVWNVPVPVVPVCQFTRDDSGKLAYSRSSETAQLSCEQFVSMLRAVEQKYGPGTTQISMCVAADPCFAKKPTAKK